MIQVFSVANYRSITNLVAELSQLNVVTGPNGSGKSNLYKALRLLSTAAHGGLIREIAMEGGLASIFYAGPPLSNAMRAGVAPIQGSAKNSNARLHLGFATEEFGYMVSLGLPAPAATKFMLDPEFKRECIWHGPVYRPASCLVDRNGAVVKIRSNRKWEVVATHLDRFDSILSELVDPQHFPEVFQVRESIRNWRFYDHFRTDRAAKTRLAKIGSRTPVLDPDGHDLAAALQTILEIGDADALHQAVEDAFPGAHLEIRIDSNSILSIEFHQHGLLRPLSEAELSDGTLRYLLLIAALLTPRPPTLMVLNEPETSLHPDLLPALANLIKSAARNTQVWVVSHASRLVAALNEAPECHSIALEKEFAETIILGQGMLDTPSWNWP